MDHQAFLSECPQTIFFGNPGKLISENSIISADGHVENQSFITMKHEKLDEIVLSTNHVGHFIFQDAGDTEMIVEQNVEVGTDDDPHGEIILVPNSMIKQEDIIEDSEVIVGSNVENEVVIDDHINSHLDSDRFVIGSSIEMGTDHIDDETFQDTKLIIDTAQYGIDDTSCISYDCLECGMMCKSRAALKKHLKAQHPKYQRRKAHKMSMLFVDQIIANRRYTCPSCSYSTQRRDKLDRHMQKHVLLDGVHPCGKKRHKPDALPQRHRHNAEEYHCPQCQYSCTVYKALKKHMKSHATGAETLMPKLSCKICGKDRATEDQMQKHMEKHRVGKSFLCDICNFSSIQLKKIIQHRRMHTGEKPHLCPHCNYRSARRDNLRSHVRRMHKKENMYIDTFNPHEDNNNQE